MVPCLDTCLRGHPERGPSEIAHIWAPHAFQFPSKTPKLNVKPLGTRNEDTSKGTFGVRRVSFGGYNLFGSL